MSGVLRGLGKYDKAIDDLTEVIRRKPRDFGGFHTRCRVLENGQLRQGCQRLQ